MVAAGEVRKEPRWPEREPTDRVVRGILRGLDSRSGFVLPTWRAWAVVTAAHWLPAPFDWMMRHLAARTSQDPAIGPPAVSEPAGGD